MTNPYPIGATFKADGQLWIVLWSYSVSNGFKVGGAPLNYSWDKDYWQVFFFPNVPQPESRS